MKDVLIAFLALIDRFFNAVNTFVDLILDFIVRVLQIKGMNFAVYLAIVAFARPEFISKLPELLEKILTNPDAIDRLLLLLGIGGIGAGFLLQKGKNKND